MAPTSAVEDKRRGIARVRRNNAILPARSFNSPFHYHRRNKSLPCSSWSPIARRADRKRWCTDAYLYRGSHPRQLRVDSSLLRPRQRSRLPVSTFPSIFHPLFLFRRPSRRSLDCSAIILSSVPRSSFPWRASPTGFQLSPLTVGISFPWWNASCEGGRKTRNRSALPVSRHRRQRQLRRRIFP